MTRGEDNKGKGNMKLGFGDCGFSLCRGFGKAPTPNLTVIFSLYPTLRQSFYNF